MVDETTENRNRARLAILELSNMISVPMSLNAVVRLNVADAIWKTVSTLILIHRRVCPLSFSSTDVVPNSENLLRILRMLTSYNVFAEHLDQTASEWTYSLTDIGKTLVTDADGLSYAPYVLQHHQDALMRAWPMVHEAVVDSRSEPFVKANGETTYTYYGKDPEMNGLMQRAMSGVSVSFMKAVLDGYDGFVGIERLVDVGGSAGDCLRMILGKYSNVKEGINFDLPEVVTKAPTIPGVTHVGGDMFQCIPAGDAIFIKFFNQIESFDF